MPSSVRASAPSSSAGCGMSGRRRWRKRCKATQEEAAGDAAEHRHPQILGSRDRCDRGRDADGIPGGLGRPHRLQQQQGEVGDRVLRQDAEGPLHPLRHPRARHGGGHERHLPARRLCAERRHLPGLHRLCAPGDAAGGADGHRRGLCHDPRFDRPRRRRADASAGRASRRAARHTQHAGVPALRRGRGRRVLGAGAEPHQRSDRAGADAAEPAAAAHQCARTTIRAATAPTSWSRAQGDAKVSLFASGSEVEIAVAAQKQLAERGIASRVVSVPVAGIAAGAAGGTAKGRHRQRAGQGRDRGRGALGLGCRDRP